MPLREFLRATSRRLRKAPQSLAVLLLFPALVGCPDLKPVKQLAKDAEAAKPALIPIAADFKGSCDRQNRYAKYTPPSVQPLLPCTEKQAADYAKLGDNILKEQALLLDYFQALGTLADADATGFEKAAPVLNTTFEYGSGLNDTQQEMAQDAGIIAAAITKMVTKDYRRNQIVDILWHANPAVQRFTRSLANQVAPPVASTPSITYLSILHLEDIQRKAFYEEAIASKSDSQTAVLLLAQYRGLNDEQERRREAAQAYRTLMLGLGKEHSILLDDARKNGFEKASIQQMSKDLAAPLSEVAAAIYTLQKDAR